MATDAPSSPPSKPRPPLVPPEERFWIRYSPHQELPLSAASSFALHILVGGLLILAAVYLSRYFKKSARPIPVEAVRLLPGGGGGSPDGTPGGRGLGGNGQEASNQGEDTKQSQAGTSSTDPDRPPRLTAPDEKQPTLNLPDANVRYVSTAPNKAYALLDKGVRETLRPRDPAPGNGNGTGTGRGNGPGGDPDKGRTGTGTGGGAGNGNGTGTGDANGPGKGNLTQREKRMLRWHMLFDTQDGNDYLSQLRQLGAILAIPLGAGDPANTEFGLVRELRRPATVRREDVRKVQRIYWIDDNARNVQAIMAALGINMAPGYFVAFMPEKLEQNLFEIEKEYMDRHHPGANEDQIQLTKFKLRRGPLGLTPYVDEMILGKGR